MYSPGSEKKNPHSGIGILGVNPIFYPYQTRDKTIKILNSPFTDNKNMLFYHF